MRPRGDRSRPRRTAAPLGTWPDPGTVRHGLGTPGQAVLNRPGPARRQVLATLTALGSVGLAGLTDRASAAPTPAWPVRGIAAGEPLRQIHAAGPSGLLAVGVSGALWALSLDGGAPRRMADGLDPGAPLASGHGRIAARSRDGRLWVWERGVSRVGSRGDLATHAGLLILPLAVIGVVIDGPVHRVVRLEPDAGLAWREVARSADAVLPDARPLQADLDGRGDGGHVVVLAGPDSRRYDHAVLGDGIEATRLLWLERHGLEVLRELTLAAPHVFEDIGPRRVTLTAGTGLLTIRSGPDGGQLALVGADPARGDRLRVLALGDAVGGRHRWLAPTTDGSRLMAVHTPHIGGVLHEYSLVGQKLSRRSVVGDVSTHRVGSRELDLAAWRGALLALPSQDGRRLRVFDGAAGWAERAAIQLPGRVAMSAALQDRDGLAILLDDGQAVLVGVPARRT